MSGCRNCGSTDLLDLGFVGELAPFFLKRVLSLENGVATSSHLLKRMFRNHTKALRLLLLKLYRPVVTIEIQTCNTCSFLQTKVPFSDEAIKNLYIDYRSESYNKERIRYEPSYAKIANEVGSSDIEIRNRVSGTTRWLRSKTEFGHNLSMLDYGGADGRFLPDLLGVKNVFELSDIRPVAGVIRIASEESLNSYSYVQVAHVLEHVSYPLDFVKHVCSFLNPGGYLYIEVPQEIDDLVLDKLRSQKNRVPVVIHEHINKYTPRGIIALIKAAGLELIAVESEMSEIGWTSAKIIRGLSRKKSV
jgi:hypothetical protein